MSEHPDQSSRDCWDTTQINVNVVAEVKSLSASRIKTWLTQADIHCDNVVFLGFLVKASVITSVQGAQIV